MLGHKVTLGKFWKIEIISSIFYDHNTRRLEINCEKKTLRNTNKWQLSDLLLNNHWITKEIREEIKQTPRNK